MDSNTPNTQPTMPPVMPAEHKKVGPIIAGLVIVLILVIVALYMFASNSSMIDDQPLPTIESSTMVNTETSASTTSSVPTITNQADDVQSLQNDLDRSTNGLDAQSI